MTVTRECIEFPKISNNDWLVLRDCPSFPEMPSTAIIQQDDFSLTDLEERLKSAEINQMNKFKDAYKSPRCYLGVLGGVTACVLGAEAKNSISVGFGGVILFACLLFSPMVGPLTEVYNIKNQIKEHKKVNEKIHELFAKVDIAQIKEELDLKIAWYSNYKEGRQLDQGIEGVVYSSRCIDTNYITTTIEHMKNTRDLLGEIEQQMLTM